MTGELLHSEKVSSGRTEALFVGLTVLSSTLLVWRVGALGWDGLAAAFLFCAVFFLFYSLNYRTLSIRLSSESLALTFGVFKWALPLDNIAECRRDDPPALARLGGAGIHFMFVRGRYRASFNFLGCPRVTLALKRPAGPVKDISLSTRRPEELLRAIREALAAHKRGP